MARFRPFGRRHDGPADHEPDPWLDDPPARALRDVDARDRREPDIGASAPATRAASPAMWAPPRPGLVEIDDDAPVTDPFGFPPVPPVVAPDAGPPARRDTAPAWAAWVPDQRPRTVAAPGDGPSDAHAAFRPGSDDGWAEDRSTAAPPAEPTADRHDVSGDTPAVSAPAVDDPAPAEPPPAESRAPDDPPGAACPAPYAPPAAAQTPSGGEPAPATTPPAAPPAPAAHDDPTAPDRGEAAALAGAFAADYLSWDEDDPARRGRALADHLPGPVADRALLGWSGSGRQRAEMVLPGAVRPDGDSRLLVDVRVRVTPYRRVSRSEATPEPDPRDALGSPAAAPPVTARGWRGLAARWVRLGVTVVRDGDRLVVDVGEETFDDPGAGDAPRDVAPARPGRVTDDPTLDGDGDDVGDRVVRAAGSRR